MARRPPSRPALVAAASRPLIDQTAVAPKQAAEWQAEAWTMFDEVGEVKYGTTLAGNAMAKLKLFIAVRPGDDPTGSPIPAADAEKEEAVDPAVAAAATADLQRLCDAAGGSPELLRTTNINLEVAGELYLVGWSERGPGEEYGPHPERWEIRSVSEVRWTTTGQERTAEIGGQGGQGGGRKGRPVDPARDTIIRVWFRHPRFQDQADSNLRGCLSDCRALLVLQQQAIAESRSRMGAGAFTVPNELTIETPRRNAVESEPDDPDRDPFMLKLEDALIDAVEDHASASSIAPFVIRGAAEFLQPQYLRHITFGRGGDDVIEKKIEARVRRLARGMNLPPEVILGHQETTFANAAQVNQDTFEDHYEPRARLLVDTLTTAYLRPGLLDAEHDPDVVNRLFVWYDASALLASPDVEANADEAFSKAAISWQAYRRVKGFDDGDAPEPLELLQRAGLLRGILTAEITVQLLNLVGGPQLVQAAKAAGIVDDPDDGEPESEPVAGLGAALLAGRSASTADAVAALERANGHGRGRLPFGQWSLTSGASPDRPGRVLMDLDRDLRARLQGAVDAAMARALERAGNRLRSKTDAAGKALLRRVPPREAWATLGPALVAATGADADSLADGAWDDLEQQFKSWSAPRQKTALKVAAKVTSGFTPKQLDEYGLRQAADLDQAWTWMKGSLDVVFKLTMDDPAWTDESEGEWDPTSKVPTGLLRQALRIAGGVKGATPLTEVSTNGLGSAWVTVPDGQSPGGIATGELIHEVFRDAGAPIDGYRWVYGPASRARPFVPHLNLDGMIFTSFIDDRLAVTGRFPLTGFYIPGDHRGCICDVEPMLMTEQEARDAGIILAPLRPLPPRKPGDPVPSSYKVGWDAQMKAEPPPTRLGKTHGKLRAYADVFAALRGEKRTGAGRSFGFDSGSIEALNVHAKPVRMKGIRRITDPTAPPDTARAAVDPAAEAIEYSFKLTAAGSEAWRRRTIGDAAYDATEAAFNNMTSTPSPAKKSPMGGYNQPAHAEHVARAVPWTDAGWTMSRSARIPDPSNKPLGLALIDFDTDAKLRNNSQVMRFDDTATGRWHGVHDGRVVTIEWTSVSRRGGNMADQSAYAAQALDNDVRIYVERSGVKDVPDEDWFAGLMETFKFTDAVRHPTDEDAAAYVESSLINIFATKTKEKLADGEPMSEPLRQAALKEIRAHLGINPDEVELISDGVDGRVRPRLPDAAVQRLVNESGVTFFTHGLSDTSVGKIVQMLSAPQGGLLSSSRRLRDAVPFGGQSTKQDMESGGADYVFTRQVDWADSSKAQTGTVLYNNSLLRDADWFAYQSDSYGRTVAGKSQYKKNYQYTDFVKELALGAKSKGSQETMIRDVASFDDAVGLYLDSYTRDGVLAKLAEKGVTHIGGRLAADFIVEKNYGATPTVHQPTFVPGAQVPSSKPAPPPPPIGSPTANKAAAAVKPPAPPLAPLSALGTPAEQAAAIFAEHKMLALKQVKTLDPAVLGELIPLFNTILHKKTPANLVKYWKTWQPKGTEYIVEKILYDAIIKKFGAWPADLKQWPEPSPLPPGGAPVVLPLPGMMFAADLQEAVDWLNAPAGTVTTFADDTTTAATPVVESPFALAQSYYKNQGYQGLAMLDQMSPDVQTLLTELYVATLEQESPDNLGLILAELQSLSPIPHVALHAVQTAAENIGVWPLPYMDAGGGIPKDFGTPGIQPPTPAVALDPAAAAAKAQAAAQQWWDEKEWSGLKDIGSISVGPVLDAVIDGYQGQLDVLSAGPDTESLLKVLWPSVKGVPVAAALLQAKATALGISLDAPPVKFAPADNPQSDPEAVAQEYLDAYGFKGLGDLVEHGILEGSAALELAVVDNMIAWSGNMTAEDVAYVAAKTDLAIEHAKKAMLGYTSLLSVENAMVDAAIDLKLDLETAKADLKAKWAGATAAAPPVAATGIDWSLYDPADVEPFFAKYGWAGMALVPSAVKDASFALGEALTSMYFDKTAVKPPDAETTKKLWEGLALHADFGFLLKDAATFHKITLGISHAEATATTDDEAKANADAALAVLAAEAVWAGENPAKLAAKAPAPAPVITAPVVPTNWSADPNGTGVTPGTGPLTLSDKAVNFFETHGWDGLKLVHGAVSGAANVATQQDLVQIYTLALAAADKNTIMKLWTTHFEEGGPAGMLLAAAAKFHLSLPDTEDGMEVLIDYLAAIPFYLPLSVPTPKLGPPEPLDPQAVKDAAYAAYKKQMNTEGILADEAAEKQAKVDLAKEAVEAEAAHKKLSAENAAYWDAKEAAAKTPPPEPTLHDVPATKPLGAATAPPTPPAPTLAPSPAVAPPAATPAAPHVPRWASREAADAWAAPVYQTWANSLTDAQNAAFEKYASTGYGPMNEQLRGLIPPMAANRHAVAELNKQVATGLFSAGPTKEKLVVYRAMTVKRPLVVGDEFTDHGFTSTSLAEEGMMPGAPVKVRITLPKGTTGAYIGGPSQMGASESEFLLTPSTTFKVTGIGADGVVEMTIVDQAKRGEVLGRVAGKAGMTRVVSDEEAIAFTKGSKLKTEFFHGTPTGASEIRAKGFDFGALGKNTNNGGVMGAGAYFSADFKIASGYTKPAKGIGAPQDNSPPVPGATVTFRVNVKKMANMGGGGKGGQPTPEWTAAMKIGAAIKNGTFNEKWDKSGLVAKAGGLEAVKKAVEPLSKFQAEEIVRVLMKAAGYDGVIWKDPYTGVIREVVIFDPENVVVVDKISTS